MHLHTWVNGQPQREISLWDRGLQYGDSIFTTLRVRKGRLVDWVNHWQRLQQAARCFSLTLPEKTLLESELQTAATLLNSGGLKCLLTRGEGRGYAPNPKLSVNRIIYTWPEVLPWSAWREGVAAVLQDKPWQWPNPCPGLKTGQAWPAVAAALQATVVKGSVPIFEHLFLTPSGQLLGGNRSNVFIYYQKTWITPPITHFGIAGVTRRFCLQKLADYAWPHRVSPISKAMLFAAEEVFLSNALFGIMPLHSLYAANGQRLWQWQPGFSRLLQDSYLFCL